MAHPSIFACGGGRDGRSESHQVMEASPTIDAGRSERERERGGGGGGEEAWGADGSLVEVLLSHEGHSVWHSAIIISRKSGEEKAVAREREGERRREEEMMAGGGRRRGKEERGGEIMPD